MRTGKQFLAITVAAMFIGGTAVAQSSNASVIEVNGATIAFEAPNLSNRQTVLDLANQLAADGFSYIEVQRTFLGRARFIAYSATKVREVVINPTSGEVLRDLMTANTGNLSEQASAAAQVAGNNGNGNSGNGNNGNGNGNSGNGNNGNGNSGNGNNGNGNGNSGN